MWKTLAFVAFFGVAVSFLVSELLHKTPTAASSPAPVVAAERPAPSSLPVARAPLAAAAPTATTTAAPQPATLAGPALRNRVEEQIPRRLYAEAGLCYRGGIDKDKRLDLTYHLSVAKGDVSIASLSTIENTLDDTALERCIHDRILGMKWHDDALPDLEEDDDLYMRVGELQRYVASAGR